MYKAMTIAGSDTSGGAGMEADLKTFQELGVYGMTALTCIVAQNPNADWAHEIYPIETAVIEKQLVTILQGIGCDAMKTGMLGSADLVELIAATIDKYELKNVVIDPVMVCKGIDTIMVPEAAAAIKELLVKRALVMTPNLLEAAYLADMPAAISSVEEMKQAAAVIHDKGCQNVILKAGDRLPGTDAVELVYDGKTFTEKRHPKIPNYHGRPGNSGKLYLRRPAGILPYEPVVRRAEALCLERINFIVQALRHVLVGRDVITFYPFRP